MATRKYKHKHIKYSSKNTRKNIVTKGGSEIKTINIKYILVNKPIVNAIKSMRNSFNIKGFKKDPNPSGFKLSRLNTAHNLSKPIIVKPLSHNSKYYSIIDGRHRFSKLAALGVEDITVEIIN